MYVLESGIRVFQQKMRERNLLTRISYIQLYIKLMFVGLGNAEICLYIYTHIHTHAHTYMCVCLFVGLLMSSDYRSQLSFWSIKSRPSRLFSAIPKCNCTFSTLAGVYCSTFLGQLLCDILWTCPCHVNFFFVLTFRHRASCILGQAFHCSPENAFYIFNQQIYFII